MIQNKLFSIMISTRPFPITKKFRVLAFNKLLLLFFIGLVSCKPSPEKEQPSTDIEGPITEKAADSTSSIALDNFEKAKEFYLNNSEDPDALIWYGRRTAYLGKYEDAIAIYTEGIHKHPEDARMYRHRGHRFISTRQYEKAISDFERAATLIAGQEDRIEPDGLPNSRNVPLSTLHGNIWYHLGLAYYLQNDLENALAAFSNRTVTERYDDNIVSGGHWLYMILRRMDQPEEAIAVIDKVVPDMDIIENTSYYKMCLFYKGLLPESDLVPQGNDASSNDVYSYGLGNWYLYHKKDTLAAKKHFKQLLETGNNYSFAYIAAEADWERIFNK